MVQLCVISGCAKQPREEERTSQYAEATLFVKSVIAEFGATEIKVPIVVYNNPGIAGATIQIDFDDKLSLKDAVNGNVLETMDFSVSNMDTKPFKCSWDSVEGEIAQDGNLLILVFSLPETAKMGDVYNVSISYRIGDVYNDNWENVNFTVINGSIAVK